MALEEKRQTIEVQKVIGEERVQIPLRAEAIVPGAGRDAVHILLDEARLCISAADMQTDRVVIDGTLHAQALYTLGSEAEVCALAANAPLSRAVDLTGAAPGMSCLCEGSVEHVETSYENGHIVFQAVACLHIRVLALQKAEVIIDLEGEDGIEQQCTQVRSLKLSAESSAQAILQGDARMPPVLDARTALMDWGSVRIDDASADLGGVKVSGSVQAEALVGSGVPGRPVALVKYALPFEQLVDMPDWLCQNVEATAVLQKLSARLMQAEDGGASLHFEAEIDIGVRALGEDVTQVLTDAYGTGGCDIACEYADLACMSDASAVTHRESVRVNLLLPEGAPSAGTVIAVRARPQIGQIERSESSAVLNGVMEAQVLYLASGSGALCSVREETPFSIECPFAISDTDDIRIDVESADASALLSDRLEISCAMRVSGMHRQETHLRMVSSVSAVPVEKKPFSVVLYWPSPGESLWEIGRRYRIPGERLAKLNEERAESEPMIVRG